MRRGGSHENWIDRNMLVEVNMLYLLNMETATLTQTFPTVKGLARNKTPEVTETEVTERNIYESG